MVKFDTVDEIGGIRKECKITFPTFMDPFFQIFVASEKDLYLSKFLFNHLLLVLLPLFCFLFIPAFYPFAFLWPVIWIWYLQSTVLFTHTITHIKPWAPGFEWLNIYVQSIVTAVLGLFLFGYEEHHLKMHHGENNFYPGDNTTTEIYERDNFFHFCVYWFRHIYGSFTELPMYAVSKGRTNKAIGIWVGLLIYIVFYSWINTFNPSAAFWCGIMPNVFASFLFMQGNWGQHQFVNPKNCRSSYGLTFNIINSSLNSINFNDGYHLMHHLNSQTRWYDLPKEFVKNQDKICQNGGLTFTNCVFQQLCLYSFTWQYGKLYGHYVPLGPEQEMTKEEFIEFIQEWYRPIYSKKAKETCFTWFLRKTSFREPVYID